MLSINKSCTTAFFLNFCNGLKSYGCFTTTFWSKYFNYSTFWVSPNSKSNVKC